MEPNFPRTALLVTGGLLIWAADFLFIYVFSAVACARGFAHLSAAGIGIVPLASIAATVAAAGANVVIFIVATRRASNSSSGGQATPTPIFVGQLAAIVAMLALLAIAFTGLPGLLLSHAC